MKKLALVLPLLTLFFVFSARAETSAECNPSNEPTTITVEVSPGEEVPVLTHALMSGHLWSSLDGLEGTRLVRAPIGGSDTVRFAIDTSSQENQSQDYVFILKRPWEPNPVTTCTVTVKIKN
jgi:hypothetical protein